MEIAKDILIVTAPWVLLAVMLYRWLQPKERIMHEIEAKRRELLPRRHQEPLPLNWNLAALEAQRRALLHLRPPVPRWQTGRSPLWEDGAPRREGPSSGCGRRRRSCASPPW